MTIAQKDDQARFYNERYAESDRGRARLAEPGRSYDRHLVELLLQELPDPLHATVLEICAGQGIEGILLSGRVGRIVCTDISREALKVARELAAAGGAAMDLVLCDAEFLPFRENSFDASFGKDALHHVPDPVAVIAEMRRCTKPGLPVMAIEANPLNPQMAFIGLVYYSVDHGVFRNTEKALRGFFLAGGLAGIRTAYSEYLPRHLLFHVSSPLPGLIRRYSGLQGLLAGVQGMGEGLRKAGFLRRFSNFIIVTGTKV